MIIASVRRLLHKIPHVGDSVWWAPKQAGGTVTKVLANGRVIFQGGPIVRNKRGREVPRWTVTAAPQSFSWNASLSMWVIGQGPIPKKRGDLIITPSPVSLSGQVRGSFAKNG